MSPMSDPQPGRPERMTGPEVTAAMKAEDVDAGLVEKAARAAYYADPFYRSVFGKMLEPREVLPWDELDLADIQELRTNARHALAAVLPEIQAQALQELLSEFATWHVYDTRDIGGAFLADNVIEEVSERVARLTATTEEPT